MSFAIAFAISLLAALGIAWLDSRCTYRSLKRIFGKRTPWGWESFDQPRGRR